MKDIIYYQNAFSNLRRNMQNGGAPHKPVLFLSVLRLFRDGDLYSNHIEPSPLLYHTFKSLWKNLVPPTAPFQPAFWYPFFHLNSESFWKLVPRFGKPIPKEVTSFSKLNELFVFATIDIELCELMLRPMDNVLLEKSLVERYFQIDYTFFTQIDIPPIEDEILAPLCRNDKAHRNTLHAIMETEEDKVMRGQIFKVVIPQIYDHTCAISRMRLNSMEKNVSMVDACHIVPFSESHDDTVGNGIALCPNLHRAFDRGLISISDDYTVLVNDNFAEDTQSVFSLSQFKDQRIKLPYDTSLYPSLRNLAIHRARWGFAV